MQKYNKKRSKTIINLLLFFIISLFLYKPALKMYYPLKYHSYIETYCAKYNVDEYLVMGVISAESGFNEDAKSHKGAVGLMQITNPTAKWCIEHFALDIDEKNINDPKSNIEIGCAYLEYLIDTYSNTKTALAAYNAGPGNVNKWLKNPDYSPDGASIENIPFNETEKYVEKVFKRRTVYYDIYEKCKN